VVEQLHLVAPVLRLLAAGRRNQEIARELAVTPETVKKHTSHILDELGAANRPSRGPRPHAPAHP
jgi:DNA-binding NarL/FixJ family response regulator